MTFLDSTIFGSDVVKFDTISVKFKRESNKIKFYKVSKSVGLGMVNVEGDQYSRIILILEIHI